MSELALKVLKLFLPTQISMQMLCEREIPGSKLVVSPPKEKGRWEYEIRRPPAGKKFFHYLRVLKPTHEQLGELSTTHFLVSGMDEPPLYKPSYSRLPLSLNEYEVHTPMNSRSLKKIAKIKEFNFLALNLNRWTSQEELLGKIK